MAYQTIEVRKLTPSIGAEIFGVDLAKPLGNQQFQEVHDALMDNLVIFFRDQKMTIDQHKDFGRRFGELHIHPNAPIEFEDHPEILVIKADEKSKHVAGEEWHSDVSCDAEPPMGCILYMHELPPDGGDTLFANMYRAYETLSEPIKRMLRGADRAARRRQGLLATASRPHDRDDTSFPNAEHPVVRTHPVTGRKALYVNRGFTTRIAAAQAQRERRAAGDALPPHRDAGVPVPLQVAAELGRLLGQPLRPAPRDVGLLPAPPLRPPRDGEGRQAVLQSCVMRAA